MMKAVEPPPVDAVIEAEALLREMKALDRNDELTPLGRLLARLPIEPRLGKMIIYGCIFSCGDAVCTIAASTTFSEPFITPMDRRRLDWVHKSLAGSRCSDHVALLHAFQLWEEARLGGEMSEMQFCDAKSLSMTTLRMTAEAKNQLCAILVNTGFPEECLTPLSFNFNGPDRNLDVIISLLAMGLYPNVCYHTGKRKVLTTESKAALVHKSSVNCTNREVKFKSPFFVFGEKIRTRAVSCKQMTMVTPLQLLLFAARSVKYDGEYVQLDSWVNLKMDVAVAARVVAIRPALESLIVKATTDPETLNAIDPVDAELMAIVRTLSRSTASRHTVITEDGESAAEMPEQKIPRLMESVGSNRGGGFRGGYRGSSFISRTAGGGYHDSTSGSFGSRGGTGSGSSGGSLFSRGGSGFGRGLSSGRGQGNWASGGRGTGGGFGNSFGASGFGSSNLGRGISSGFGSGQGGSLSRSRGVGGAPFTGASGRGFGGSGSGLAGRGRGQFGTNVGGSNTTGGFGGSLPKSGFGGMSGGASFGQQQQSERFGSGYGATDQGYGRSNAGYSDSAYGSGGGYDSTYGGYDTGYN
jgi:ATP-dependent RNA helicase A